MTDETPHPPRRLIVVPVAKDSLNRVLLCRMAPDRGVFPGRWALPGGGVEDGERIEDALRREIIEELGVELESAEPLFFKDAVLPKTLADGSVTKLQMVFLIYGCRLSSQTLELNDELDRYDWVAVEDVDNYGLTDLTRETLIEIGWLSAGSD